MPDFYVGPARRCRCAGVTWIRPHRPVPLFPRYNLIDAETPLSLKKALKRTGMVEKWGMVGNAPGIKKERKNYVKKEYIYRKKKKKSRGKKKKVLTKKLKKRTFGALFDIFKQ